ncbi:hypothetical protein COV93_01875, partial [Candidatus Woesearchaeota archaeon CG11_big_fil_rev_8_21_14_0_20_43_8]
DDSKSPGHKPYIGYYNSNDHNLAWNVRRIIEESGFDLLVHYDSLESHNTFCRKFYRKDGKLIFYRRQIFQNVGILRPNVFMDPRPEWENHDLWIHRYYGEGGRLWLEYADSCEESIKTLEHVRKMLIKKKISKGKREIIDGLVRQVSGEHFDSCLRRDSQELFIKAIREA